MIIITLLSLHAVNIFSWDLNLLMPFNDSLTLKYETNLFEEMSEIPFVVISAYAILALPATIFLGY